MTQRTVYLHHDNDAVYMSSSELHHERDPINVAEWSKKYGQVTPELLQLTVADSLRRQGFKVIEEGPPQHSKLFNMFFYALAGLAILAALGWITSGFMPGN